MTQRTRQIPIYIERYSRSTVVKESSYKQRLPNNFFYVIWSHHTGPNWCKKYTRIYMYACIYVWKYPSEVNREKRFLFKRIRQDKSDITHHTCAARKIFLLVQFVNMFLSICLCILHFDIITWSQNNIQYVLKDKQVITLCSNRIHLLQWSM